MKKFNLYKDIRTRARIFGLPVPLFALQLLGIIASLLTIIFSFSFTLVLGAMLLNGILYGVLLKLTNEPDLLHWGRVLPRAISNKKTNLLHYTDEP